MIRLIIIVVVGLIAGVGGGTGLAVVRARQSWSADSATRRILAESLAVHNDSAAADSTAPHLEPDSTDVASSVKGVTAGDSAHAPAAALSTQDSTTAPRKAGESSVAHIARPPGGKRSDSASTPIALPPKPLTVAHADGAAPAGAEPAPTVMPTRKIARIFAAMPPKEASKVLEQLDDSDVRTILSSLNEKQAATILSNFPPQRAASISKAAMRAARTAP